MGQHSKTICLIVGGISEKTLRLQPWRYLHEVALQLSAHGHAVTIISDGAPAGADEVLHGVSLQRVPSVHNFRWRENSGLRTRVEAIKPNLILWNLGVTSLLHQQLSGWNSVPVVGVFTSPIYTPRELARLGIGRIVRGHKLSAIHVAGTLAPRMLLRQIINRGPLKKLVVQSHATRARLVEGGALPQQVRVITPGVDEVWKTRQVMGSDRLRADMGYNGEDTVVLYFGSPAPLRGLHTLIRAMRIARLNDPSLKLLVLNRRHADELLREDSELRDLLSHSGTGQFVQMVNGFLDEQALVRHVAAADIVALPFELVPSDAPLSLLEAQALGKPVVTSALGCLPELVMQGPSYLAQPADPDSLARALERAAHDLRVGVAGEQRQPLEDVRSWEQMGAEWSSLVQSL